ncbi:formin homology 2 domain-containing protein / FH2domain-containing protein [Striga asiatica]|uniref:Formin homology 2 domain-containing protein / FH2domain-containing protein n=1 Tax=Striga asiatica TaxID=4170 RepID=A0A5A7Q4W4_STRAF|nr:formin homology 2 domain-containing protein / FH2domain-containing protein [Striga asiatica]
MAPILYFLFSLILSNSAFAANTRMPLLPENHKEHCSDPNLCPPPPPHHKKHCKDPPPPPDGSGVIYPPPGICPPGVLCPEICPPGAICGLPPPRRPTSTASPSMTFASFYTVFSFVLTYFVL